MEAKGIMSEKHKLEIANYVSKALSDSMLESQKLINRKRRAARRKCQNNCLISIDDLIEEIVFLVLYLKNIAVNRLDILELSKLVKRSIKDFNYTESTNFGYFSTFISRILENIIKKILIDENLSDMEKAKKIRIVNKWFSPSSINNFGILRSLESYYSWEYGRFAVFNSFKEKLYTVNLEQAEDEFNKMMQYAINWWIELLKQYGYTQGEILKFEGILSLMLPGIVKYNGLVELSTDYNVDQLLRKIFSKIEVYNILPEGIEMLITSEKIIVKNGVHDRAKTIYTLKAGEQPFESNKVYQRKY
ncbi:MAG TPA: hypothetical protein PLX66_00180 [Bacilli bacterium]|nr:hypothetical protein [Bacilli bacterium]